MPHLSNHPVLSAVNRAYRTESRRVLATLIRLLGDFDLAEEAMQDAFATAVESWSREGIPNNPRAWLVSTGRFKAIDAIRRRVRFDASLSQLAHQLEQHQTVGEPGDDEGLEDDQLRLIFTCCHPALSADTQVALTLREVCGLTTDEIARAFLSAGPTIAQRIVRGKSKIRDAGIPYEIPERKDVPDRLDSVLAVIYLVFNEGYSASTGTSLTRADLSGEAIRLGRLIVGLMPHPEAVGLLSLMLLQESRRQARSTPEGDLILLEDQDRALWNQEQIREGALLVQEAFASGEVGLYTVQAAIAVEHATAATPQVTDWSRIIALYDLIESAAPSPIIRLNRAVAIAMRDGPEIGLDLVEELLKVPQMQNYPLAHAAKADLCRRSGQTAKARNAYETALKLTQLEPERRFLMKRIRELA